MGSIRPGEATFERQLDTRDGPVVRVEDNGGGGVKAGKPLYVAIRFKENVPEYEDGGFLALTLEETTRLRNLLNEAIVWAEGATAQR